MGNDRCKVLIVDDEPINIQLLESALSKDYDICSSRNGLDAIYQIKRQMPDLILLDIMMPDMNGIEVCQAIKADETFSSIPVIFLTAMDTFEGEIEGFEAGAIDYMKKPVNLELLKHRVHNHLLLKRQTDLIREQRDLLERRKEELEAALVRVKQLEGLISICMYCKKIRNEQSDWESLEKYITEHSEAEFSHGLCPTCAAEQMEIIRKM